MNSAKWRYIDLIRVIIFAIVILCLSWNLGKALHSLGYIEKIDHAGIAMGWLFTSVSISIAFVAWWKRENIRQWLLNPLHSGYSVNLGKKVNNGDVDVLVVMVSSRENGNIMPEWIIRTLEPKIVELMYTIESKINAEKVYKSIVMDFSETIQVEPPSSSQENLLTDHRSIKEAYNKVKALIQFYIHEMNFDPNRIAVDTTNGTVPMSLGAFAAAYENRVPTLYVYSQDNDIIRDPTDSAGEAIYLTRAEGRKFVMK